MSRRPSSDTAYLLEGLDEHGVLLPPPDEIRPSAPINHRLVACVPQTVILPDGTLIVNPGSVGMPAYTHDEPSPYKMETGSPPARYALI